MIIICVCYIFRNKIYVRKNREEFELVVDPNMANRRICSPPKLGLDVCMKAGIPSRWNGLMTPLHASFEIVKTDETATGIEIELKADKSIDIDGQLSSADYKAYYNMPGGSQDRKLLAQLKFSRRSGFLNADFETPWKKARLSMTASNSERSTALAASLDIGDPDDIKHYQVAMARTISQVTQGNRTYDKKSLSIQILVRNILFKINLYPFGFLFFFYMYIFPAI